VPDDLVAPVAEYDHDEGLGLLGIGRDANGELDALANATGTPFGDSGEVLRIDLASGLLSFTQDLSRIELGLAAPRRS